MRDFGDPTTMHGSVSRLVNVVPARGATAGAHRGAEARQLNPCRSYPRAEVTTDRASSWMRARCSGPRKLSAYTL